MGTLCTVLALFIGLGVLNVLEWLALYYLDRKTGRDR